MLGASDLRNRPGLYVFDVDDHWRVELNAHPEEIEGVPGFHARVNFCDWPAGVLSPIGGVIAAGAAANEDTFIEALQERLARGA